MSFCGLTKWDCELLTTLVRPQNLLRWSVSQDTNTRLTDSLAVQIPPPHSGGYELDRSSP